MSSEWQLSTVGDFCPFKYGKGLPERDRKPGAYGVYSSAGLVGWHDSAYVNASGIVVGRKGTVGSVTFSAKPFWPIDTAFYVDDQPRIRDIHFTYYLLKTLDLHLMNTDSAVPGLNRDNAHAIEVRIPPLSVQRDIANFLRLMDDRITLLRETNTTLEAIAQVLFKSWFVDFDPVRAKSEGKLPEGIDEATAALFPDAFEETELGLVPKGWKVGAVENLCTTITNGGTPSRSKQEFWTDGKIPWFKTGELSDGFLLQPSERITELAVQSSSVKVLPEDSVLMAIYAAPTVGRLGVLTEPAAFNQACTGMVAKPEVGTWFLYWALHFGRDWFNSRANGAAQQNISKAIVSGYKVVVPETAVLNAFNTLCESIHGAIKRNSLQADTLANLRDTLLPRLISGQLRIADAEAELEKVTA